MACSSVFFVRILGLEVNGSFRLNYYVSSDNEAACNVSYSKLQ